jgi:hypothetical protein
VELRTLLDEHRIVIIPVAGPFRDAAENIEPPTEITVAGGHSVWVGDINGLMLTDALHSSLFGPRRSVPQFARRARLKQPRLGYRIKALENHPCDWMEGHLQRLVDRLRAQLSGYHNVQVELELASYRLDLEGYSVTLRGQPDMVARSPLGPEIWEIKLTSALLVEDTIQSMVYGLMLAKQENMQRLPPIVLFNVGIGQKIHIEGTVEDVEALLVALIRLKYKTPTDAAIVENWEQMWVEVKRNFDKSN